MITMLVSLISSLLLPSLSRILKGSKLMAALPSTMILLTCLPSFEALIFNGQRNFFISLVSWVNASIVTSYLGFSTSCMLSSSKKSSLSSSTWLETLNSTSKIETTLTYPLRIAYRSSLSNLVLKLLVASLSLEEGLLRKKRVVVQPYSCLPRHQLLASPFDKPCTTDCCRLHCTGYRNYRLMSLAVPISRTLRV